MPSTSNRRRRPRKEVVLPATVRWATPQFETETSNLSADGVYFILNRPLTLEVTINGERRTGRLVRVESRTAAHDELGFAVRLDPVKGPPRSNS